MAKVVFILGLAASGKTTLLKKMKEQHSDLFTVDEGFNPLDPGQTETFQRNYEAVRDNLRRGTNCAVVEAGLCIDAVREEVLRRLRRDVVGLEIDWRCFKNEPEKAMKNVMRRGDKDIAGFRTNIYHVSRLYTFPAGAEILPIKTENTGAET
jgi:hypothetical protein